MTRQPQDVTDVASHEFTMPAGEVSTSVPTTSATTSLAVSTESRASHASKYASTPDSASTSDSAPAPAPTDERSPYARLFAIPGAKAFSFSGALARLPMSMMGLGIVLALNYMYDNWTIAGTMSAAYVLATAAVTPFYARLFDRFGQRRVGKFVLAIQVIAMLAFAFAALARIPIVWLFPLAIVMGLTQFSFGALVRTRWAYVLQRTGNEDLLNTAYAFESAVDELVFILGPILAAFLAASVHPVSQLFLPTLACAIGGAIFFGLRDTQPPVMRVVNVTAADASDVEVRAAEGRVPLSADAFDLDQLKSHTTPKRSVLLYRGIIPLLLTFVVYNMAFTAFDCSMTAVMKAMGLQQVLGVQLAMLAVGSCIGALIFGSRELKGSLWRNMIIFLVLLTIGFAVIHMLQGNLVLMGAVEVLAGLVVSPVFASGNLIVKNTVPERSLTEGLSWLSTAGTVGASFGSLVAGVVLDHVSTDMSLTLPWVFVLASIPCALLGWFLVRKRG